MTTSNLTQSTLELARHTFNTLSEVIYANNVKAGWFSDPKTKRRIVPDPLQKLMLMVTEIAECAEGVRKGVPDTHLPHRPMEEVELADVLVRLFEYAGWRELDVGGAFVEKILYNAQREDHKMAIRAAAGGKKC